MSAILKENTANDTSSQKISGKKYELPASSIQQKKIANNRKMTML